MAKTVWTEPAEADMDDIYAWIAHRDGRRQTAKQVVRELRAHCDTYAAVIAAGSLIGTPYPNLGEDIRIFTHKRWAIVFRPIVGGIEIVRVFDASRDFPRLLGD